MIQLKISDNSDYLDILNKIIWILLNNFRQFKYFW